jgi:predicted metal-dependent hydrolase
MTAAEPHSIANRDRWKVRRVAFDYAGAHVTPKSWHPAEPEFARLVEALSVSMPYLEPYLIQTMREVKADLDDPVLVREVDLYIGQESAHFRQHQKLNDEIAKTTSHSRPLEAVFQADYKAFRETRSTAFHLAYAEGFEALTMAIAQTLVEDRVRLWGGASAAPVSMILWHMVEEIEHKTVTFDVFERLHGSYWMRVYGFFYASGHLLGRGFQGYAKMLREDGLAANWQSRWRRWRTLGRFFFGVGRRAARVLSPWYDPRQTRDPAWALAWIARYEREGASFKHLDMARLVAPEPVL